MTKKIERDPNDYLEITFPKDAIIHILLPKGTDNLATTLAGKLRESAEECFLDTVEQGTYYRRPRLILKSNFRGTEMSLKGYREGLVLTCNEIWDVVAY